MGKRITEKLVPKAAILFIALWAAGTVPLQGRMLSLSATGNDSASCRAGAEFRTLKRAVECLAPGDTLIIRQGTYQGGVIITVKATEEAPVLIQGENLDAVISGSGEEVDGIRVQESSYVTLDRLTVRQAKRAGCSVRFSNHIRVTRSRFADNGTWGIFTSFADDILFEGNECYGSVKEHGIYHSNSGDRFVIRGNLVHHNRGNGIHLNGDPEIKGGDGVLNQGLVEKNIIYANGRGGGAGINMTHVHDVLVRNNLIFNNYAAGMTVYQDTGTFEQGSKRVVIMGNTVVFQPNLGRACVNIQTTSEKVLLAGNIFVSGVYRGAIEVNSDHLETVVSNCNLLWGAPAIEMVERKDKRMSIADWRALSGNDTHSIIADPQFVDPSTFDFSLKDTSPALDAGMPLESVRSILRSLGGFEWILSRLETLPDEDNQGRSRPVSESPDIGAYESR